MYALFPTDIKLRLWISYFSKDKLVFISLQNFLETYNQIKHSNIGEIWEKDSVLPLHTQWLFYKVKAYAIYI